MNVWADLSRPDGRDRTRTSRTSPRRRAGATSSERIRQAFRYAERPNRFLYGSDWPLAPMTGVRELHPRGDPAGVSRHGVCRERPEAVRRAVTRCDCWIGRGDGVRAPPTQWPSRSGNPRPASVRLPACFTRLVITFHPRQCGSSRLWVTTHSSPVAESAMDCQGLDLLVECLAPRPALYRRHRRPQVRDPDRPRFRSIDARVERSAFRSRWCA